MKIYCSDIITIIIVVVVIVISLYFTLTFNNFYKMQRKTINVNMSDLVYS